MSIARSRAALNATLLLLLGGPLQAEDSSFIKTYLDAHGGCNEQAPLLTFEQGIRNSRAPFGRAAEDWTSDDLQALKATMAGCVVDPNGFDISQENQIFKNVVAAVDEGRRSAMNRQRQAAAARQMAEERAEAASRRERDRVKRQDEQAAFGELQGFYGHIMSEAERDRANQLKERMPTLAVKIDGLLSAQARLREEAEEQAQHAQEREEAARRIAAEEAKRVLEEKRAEQEAEVEAERKREAFAAALPAACKKAQSTDRDLEIDAQRGDFARAVALADAGDTKTACASFKTYVSKLDTVRATFVQCTKDLDANLDDLARQEASRSLDRAKEIYAAQKALRQKTQEMSCE